MAADINYDRFGSAEEENFGPTFYGLATDPKSERTDFVLHMAKQNFSNVPDILTDPY